MKKFSSRACFDEAMKTLKIARNEAEKRGDVENLINIGITYYEFATKVPTELEEDKGKKIVGFVSHEG